MVRLAKLDDIDFLKQYDYEVYNLENDINNNLVYIIEDKINIGFLRYSLFWNRIPFINMLYIKKEYQNMGYGTKLLNDFIKIIKDLGFKEIMTSCVSLEDGKYFFLKNKFNISGGFNPIGEGYELIMSRKLEA